jgi:hypothetical protein
LNREPFHQGEQAAQSADQDVARIAPLGRTGRVRECFRVGARDEARNETFTRRARERVVRAS